MSLRFFSLPNRGVSADPNLVGYLHAVKLYEEVEIDYLDERGETLDEEIGELRWSVCSGEHWIDVIVLDIVTVSGADEVD